MECSNLTTKDVVRIALAMKGGKQRFYVVPIKQLKVYVVQSRRTMMLHGCFISRKAAEDYVSRDSQYFAIHEMEVA